jgi:hypothetical protein
MEYELELFCIGSFELAFAITVLENTQQHAVEINCNLLQGTVAK